MMDQARRKLECEGVMKRFVFSGELQRVFSAGTPDASADHGPRSRQHRLWLDPSAHTVALEYSGRCRV